MTFGDTIDCTHGRTGWRAAETMASAGALA
jgi:hypothetical protein